MTLTTIDINAVNSLSTALAAKADKAGGSDITINKASDALLTVESTGASPRLRAKRSTGMFEIENTNSNNLAVSWYDAASVFQRTLLLVKSDGQVRVDSGDLMLTGTAGTVRSFKLASSNVSRFKIGLGSGAETGSNTGSTFAVWRCDDAGNDIDAPFIIDRVTGMATFGANLHVKAAGTPVVSIEVPSGATGTNTILSFDPSGNGFNTRDAQIRGKSTGSATQVGLEFWTANAAAPVKQLEILPSTGVANFTNRPTWNGAGLATQAEAAAGGGGAGVSSFAGRTGAVTPTLNDYAATQISYSGGVVSTTLDTLSLNRVNRPANWNIWPANTAAQNTTGWNAMMAAIGNGSIVIWPEGDFNFSGTIVQSKTLRHIGVPNKATNGSGTRWMFGASDQINIFQQAGGKFEGITFYKTAQGANLLVAPDSTNAPTGSSGSYVYQGGTSYVDFEDCQFYGPCTSALVYMTNCLKWTFRYTKFLNTYTGGQTRCVWLNGGNYDSTKTTSAATGGDNIDNVEFTNCMFAGEALATRIDGVQIDGKADSTKFFQCAAVWLYYGVWLTKTGPTTQVPNFTRWTQGGFENNYKNAIKAEYGDITTFSDMYASLDNSTTSDTNYGSTDVVLVDTTYVGSIEFTACQMRGGKRDAYRLEGGRIQINGGQAGNSAVRATGYGVDALSSINSLIMQGVDCRPMATGTNGQTYAVRNLKGGTNVIINGCNLSGQSSGAFQSGGTGTGITGNLT
jgi:hypothetical protein